MEKFGLLWNNLYICSEEKNKEGLKYVDIYHIRDYSIDGTGLQLVVHQDAERKTV
jgi:hypothetical protein